MIYAVIEIQEPDLEIGLALFTNKKAAQQYAKHLAESGSEEIEVRKLKVHDAFEGGAD